MAKDKQPAKEVVSHSSRDCYLHVLGTGSQVPTAHRNHNGYLLCWYDDAFLFDPGEGVQRQFCRMEISASKVSRIFISHFHGDHCLGLPGLIMRLGLQDYPAPIHVYFPSSGRKYVDALLSCTAHVSRVEIELHPTEGGRVLETDSYAVEARPLRHSVETLGYVFQEKPKRRFDKEKLRAAGLENSPLNRDLLRDGAVDVGGRRITLDEVSQEEKGYKFSFLMDTRLFDGCESFARDADLLLAESTYLDADHRIARERSHMCTTEVARLAKESGTRRLLLSHFSQRYPDNRVFEREARKIFDPSMAAEDLMTIRL